jgi:hypothetical protein
MNMNDMVRIKLKPAGEKILRDKHDKLNRWIKKRNGSLHDFDLRLDAEGYYRTQLWCVMQDFGPHIRLGAEAPFETEILLDTPPPQPLRQDPTETK